jgi:hypothetical protein
VKLWQRHAYPLPIRVRPIYGETLLSYTRRLSQANAFESPTTILRALGEPTRLLYYDLFTDFDAQLNEPALQRLETYTGIPRQRLRKALPALHATATDLGDSTPRTRPHRCWNIRTACDDCVRRLPGRPDVRVHLMVFPLICERHRRWIHTNDDHPEQFDLTATPEIVTAHHKYAKLRAANQDTEWSRRQLHAGTYITTTWARRSLHLKRLPDRWQARAHALGMPAYRHNPPHALTFPEAVILAHILSNPDWRRHVAMVPDHQLRNFFHHIATRLGENPQNFTLRLDNRYLRPKHEPLNNWIRQHRHEHQHIRDDFYAQPPSPHARPFPENRHFK